MYVSKVLCIFLMLVSCVLLSCEADHSVSTQPTPVQDQQSGVLPDISSIGDGPGAVKVMTRNIYIGADVDIVLSAQNPEDIPVLVAQAFQGVIATRFPERAIALTKEIAMTQPHLIGLQEVSLFRIQSPGDAVIGGTVPAEVVFMDYLNILMMTLKAAGLDYKVVAKVQNADVELPMITGVNPMTFDDVRITDYDVILARGDVDVSNGFSANYAVNLVIPTAGIEVLRGYVAADARVGKKTYRFVNTHLEPFSIDIQLAQIAELLNTIKKETLPVIMVGDFNTPAPAGETYNVILESGFCDIWTMNTRTDNPNGFTFGHDADLMNDEAHFWERIDFIFVKNNNPYTNVQLLDPVLATVVGDELQDRTPSGLWPSDHGGVVARLRIPASDRLIGEDLAVRSNSTVLK